MRENMDQNNFENGHFPLCHLPLLRYPRKKGNLKTNENKKMRTLPKVSRRGEKLQNVFNPIKIRHVSDQAQPINLLFQNVKTKKN